MPLAAPRLRKAGPNQSCCSTGLEQLFAISKSSTVSGFGPITCHRQRCFGMILSHQKVIGSISFKANSMLLVVLLWNDFGPLGGHRQHLIQGELGQLEAIGSTALEQLWAINKSLVVFDYGPTPCHR